MGGGQGGRRHTTRGVCRHFIRPPTPTAITSHFVSSIVVVSSIVLFLLADAGAGRIRHAHPWRLRQLAGIDSHAQFRRPGRVRRFVHFHQRRRQLNTRCRHVCPSDGFRRRRLHVVTGACRGCRFPRSERSAARKCWCRELSFGRIMVRIMVPGPLRVTRFRWRRLHAFTGRQAASAQGAECGPFVCGRVGAERSSHTAEINQKSVEFVPHFSASTAKRQHIPWMRQCF